MTCSLLNFVGILTHRIARIPSQKSQKTRGGQGASSSLPAYNRAHFLNLEALEAYAKGLGSKTFVDKRGFDYKSLGLGEFFASLNWGDSLCGTPVQAVAPIVREFYANAKG